MKYTPIGVDIAKHLIQVHLVNEHTGKVVNKQLRRQNFLAFFSNREPCLIGMEACGGSQHWARELEKLEHSVRLVQGRFVKAFVIHGTGNHCRGGGLFTIEEKLRTVACLDT
jgi:transposase